MKKIRDEIRDYLLTDVNRTLARLGVSEEVKETMIYEDKYRDRLKYSFESAPIRQLPMMFAKVIVDGYMVATELEEGSRFARWSAKHDIVVVSVDYRYELFDGGTNGCSIGRIIYAVKKNLPERFDDFAGIDGRQSYVQKLEGLII